ncbi:hypothetical protein Tco_1054847 [Tanacetum coccineum]|uniref:Uncharacterized protein n=1 Tax=Tanacetum coccineum TaxID=301880 RepID=A0ABQ5GZF5_9ASTR
MMDSWKKYTLGCKQKRQPQKENLSLLWIVAREKKLRKGDRGKAPEGRTNKDETGRIAKWAIKLGESEIEFKPKNPIKAQFLADFLVETQEEDEETDFLSQEEKKKRYGLKAIY